jgi:dUTP pyrophosphatase
MKIQIVNNSLNTLPEYTKPGDAGLDLRADFSKEIKTDSYCFADYDEIRNVILIFPGGRALIPTNLHVAIPEGHELQIRPRSGLALKNGISVLNTPGTVDSGYRNSIGVILINLGNAVFEVAQGDRIAQAVLNKFETIEWESVLLLSETKRGMSGFGDSGVK